MQTYQLAEVRSSESTVRRWPTRESASSLHNYARLDQGRSSSNYVGLREPTAERALASQTYVVREPVPDRFTEYEAYDVRDWDGYDGEPISAATIAWTRSFYEMLPRGHLEPDIAPAGDGTIGFEWVIRRDAEQQLVFVDVGPGERFRVRQIRSDGSLLEAWPSVGVDELSRLVSRLSPLLR